MLGPGHPGALVATSDGVLVADTTSGIVSRLAASGIVLGRFQLPVSDVSHGLALDNRGDVYAGRYPSTLVKYDPSGRFVWSRPTKSPLMSVFVTGQGANERVGITHRDGSAAESFTLDGLASGPLAASGYAFTSSSNGGVVGIDAGRFVRSVSSAGQPTTVVGSQSDNDTTPMGGPFHFYQLGGVAQLPDGRLLVTDTHAGIMVLSPAGLILGELPPTAVDPAGLTEQSAIAVANGFVFVEGGAPFSNSQYVYRLRLSDLLADATHGETADPRLGIGAGLVMTDPDHYLRAGQSAVVRAQFDSWWQRLAPQLTLCWQLRSIGQLRSGATGMRGVVPVSRIVDTANGTPLPLPHGLAPGAYQVDAYLVRNGASRAVSRTRLVFSVAAPWMKLNLATLPAGADWGGPSPARGVALAAQLGTNAFRFQLDWSKLLDHGANEPLDLTAYLPQLQAAAAEAQRTGATLIVQVGQGGPEKSLVADGTWAGRVRELVAGLKSYVHVWEAWNEPNATFGAAAEYVDKVLKPFSQAVHAVDPAATVVGGSTVGVDLGYWKGIVAAGGLQWLNVAAIHPYTGHNRSWEENGTVAQLQSLRSLLGPKLPIWDTEQAWWSSGTFDLVAQADNSARAILWMRALGIEKWAYFIPEGGWGDFSAIQVDDYVKPSALAIMTAENQLAGRPFLGEVNLGAPAAYALRFGPRAGKGGDLLVAWTDGLRLPVRVTGAASVTDAFGSARRPTSTLLLDSGPVYLHGAAKVRPVEPFGPDLALGGTARASSANPSNPASAAIDGIDGAAGGGDLPGLPMWVSAPGDRRPVLTVTLRRPMNVDRILLGTHSLGSIVTGLRDYDVDVRGSLGAAWKTVGRVRGQFYDRHALVGFSPRTVAQVRIVVRSVDFSGYVDEGAKPPFWPTDNADLTRAASPWYGPAVVSELAAFAPHVMMRR